MRRTFGHGNYLIVFVIVAGEVFENARSWDPNSAHGVKAQVSLNLEFTACRRAISQNAISVGPRRRRTHIDMIHELQDTQHRRPVPPQSTVCRGLSLLALMYGVVVRRGPKTRVPNFRQGLLEVVVGFVVRDGRTRYLLPRL